MEIGYAEKTITPDLGRPVYLAGFAPNRRAEKIHDDLSVRALALREDGRTLILAALDLIGFFRRDVKAVTEEFQSAAAQAGSPPEVLLASLHPHHGPDTMGLWGPDSRTSGVDPAYMSLLREKIIATLLEANSSLQPVGGFKTVSVHLPGLAKNARDPAVVDDELVAAQFLDADGQALAAIFNFPCHPEVLWENNTQITADYPGYLRKEVQRLTGAPCLFFSADLGGMMTPDVRDHSFEEADFMGKALAQAGVEALKKAPALPAPGGFSWQKREIRLKLRNILFKIAIRRGLFPDIREDGGTILSEAGLLKIGPLWLATVPGELLPGPGMALKDEMRRAGAGVAGVIGLANDELGYILPRESFRYPPNPLKPGKHYEETMSVSREIGPAVLAAIGELLHG